MRKSIYSPEQEALRSLLRQLRLEAGLQQRELSQCLGKPQSFVSRYESGQRRLDLLEIRQICQAIGISLAAFVERFERLLR